MTRYDILVSDLCFEIDDLKDQVKYWQDRFESERAAHDQTLTNYDNSVKDSIGQLLSLAIRSVDTPEGVLIQKEPRI